MRDSQAMPGFGELELDVALGDEHAPVSGRPSTSGSAGPGLEEPPPPPSTSRVFRPATGGGSGPAPRGNPASNHEMTRVMPGDLLASITGPPPPPADDHTRAWGEVDPPPNEPVADSASGVASRDDGRVAAMRELYAQGDAEGALVLAESLVHSLVPSAPPDPFGGLIPMDDELAARATAPPPQRIVLTSAPPARSSAPPPRTRSSIPPHVLTVPQGAGVLSPKQRQSIPRMLVSAGELAKLPIDHRAGFLLAHVDGMQTVEEILDVCAMPTKEALELITKLEAMGVIELE